MLNLKKQDILFILIALCLFLPFVLSGHLHELYKTFNAAHPYIMAFIKFSLLSTLGECLGLRIKEGSYNKPGFGILPRMIVWGFLGIWIAVAMKTFAAGVPPFLQSLGIYNAGETLADSALAKKITGAFFISLFMNTTFGPVFMTLHKISDMHILQYGGKVTALLHPIHFADAFRRINWDVQWGFVFKKTIPFFWIPAHTVTFMLPANVQVLFAALLGVALGLILSIAARR